jgi:hypothetical protein
MQKTFLIPKCLALSNPGISYSEFLSEIPTTSLLDNHSTVVGWAVDTDEFLLSGEMVGQEGRKGTKET